MKVPRFAFDPLWRFARTTERIRWNRDADATPKRRSTSFMPSNRTRIRAITAVGAGAVVVALSTVTYNASAAETSGSDAARATAAGRRPAPGVQSVRPPAESLIPANIRPPAGSKLIGAEIVVSGTQTYTCK